MKNKDITSGKSKMTAERKSREGYHKKKQLVPQLSCEEVEAAKAFQNSLNREFEKIMFSNHLSVEELVERLSPCVSESSVVYKIIASTRTDVNRKDKRNVTMAILAALRYAFGLDINRVADELLKEISVAKKSYDEA